MSTARQDRQTWVNEVNNISAGVCPRSSRSWALPRGQLTEEVEVGRLISTADVGRYRILIEFHDDLQLLDMLAEVMLAEDGWSMLWHYV